MLKLDITDLSYDPEPYDFKGSKVAIRPWPFSRTDLEIKDGAIIVSGDKRLECFLYCLCGWDFLGADGNPLPCTAEVKKTLFDFNVEPDLIPFVLDKSRFFHIRKEEAEKNFIGGSGTISES